MPSGNSAADRDTASNEAIIRQLSDLLPVKEKTGKWPVRQPLPAHLPRQETVFMSEIGCTCPNCGSTMRHISNGVNEVPVSVPAHVVVKRTVRPQYSCPFCDTVHSAVLSSAVIDKGQPGPALLAQGGPRKCRSTCRCRYQIRGKGKSGKGICGYP